MPEAGAAVPRMPPAPLAPPSATSGLLEVFRRRYLLKLLIRREISARYQGSFLGLLWSYINPLSQFAIYYVVLGQIVGLGDRTENFAIHVFTGLVIVHFFTETLNAGTRSIVRNRQLVQKMALPREMFPVASMLVSGFHIGPQLVILLIACLLNGWAPDAAGLGAGVLALSIAASFGMALALVLSVANVFLRDITNAVNVLTNLVRFSVPMIYPFTLVDQRFEGYVGLYLSNPVATAVLLLQRCFWTGTTDDPAVTVREHMPGNLVELGFIALGVSLVLLVLAQLIFSRLDSKIPERL